MFSLNINNMEVSKMDFEKKMELLADVFDVEADELTPETELESLDFDSVAVLSFIAMMDEGFGKAIKGSEVKGLKTIQDMLDIMN